jgi:hypothetical protein
MLLPVILAGLGGGTLGLALIVVLELIRERRERRRIIRLFMEKTRIPDDERERAIRNGVCPVCGTVPGMPCDLTVHAAA